MSYLKIMVIDQDPDGSQSQLFQDLLQKYNGDRDKAIIERAKSFDYLSADIQTRNLSFEEQFLSSTDENARFIEVSIDNLNKYNFNTKKELDDRLRSIRKNLEQGLISRLNSIDEKARDATDEIPTIIIVIGETIPASTAA